VHDEGGQGRMSVVTDGLVQRIDEVIRENCRFTISALSMKFPEVSRSSLHFIVKEHLSYKKLCTYWVPRLLTDNHKTRRMFSALTFLDRYATEEEDFLKSVVTGDETWIQYDIPETKRQSQQ